MKRKAKIIATIGPASASPEILTELILQGMDVARLNMSHGSYSQHAEAISNIRSISDKLKRPVAILLDLCGPKLRTGPLPDGKPILLTTGSKVIISTENPPSSPHAISINYPYLTQDIRINDRLLIDDGLIELLVEDKSPKELLCKVIHGGILGEHKGINFPSSTLSIPSITEKDLKDIEFGLSLQVDFFALSFVRNANDCLEAKKLIESSAKKLNLNYLPQLVAKIEKADALANLDAILQVADAIMVARGDLALETLIEAVPISQKEIIRKAINASKPVFTATQMLQSMTSNPKPTRAEVADVANAILDGSDALMLSAETASGSFPVQALQTMDKIITFTENASSSKNTPPHLHHHTRSLNSALAEAAVFAALEIQAPLIAALSHQGKIVRKLAALRPTPPILALTTSQHTYHCLAAVWGVIPLLLPEPIPQYLNSAILQLNLAKPSDPIVLVAGSFPSLPISNFVKLHYLDNPFMSYVTH
ncbi:MAG: pyruvate kinase [Acidobacteriota bacterium]|nr:pyruvate kinase [Acidobacteriota bacterium]